VQPEVILPSFGKSGTEERHRAITIAQGGSDAGAPDRRDTEAVRSRQGGEAIGEFQSARPVALARREHSPEAQGIGGRCRDGGDTVESGYRFGGAAEGM